jgi:Domain of unknown function (DUF305)
VQNGQDLTLRFLKPNVDAALLGATVFIAFLALSLMTVRDAFHELIQPATGAIAKERPFLNENYVAMTKMMNDMTAEPSGDIDRDFVAMMAPHHQGAIDMAVIELHLGKNEQLRRIAQEIIIDQMQEIATMKLAIGEQVSTAAPARTQSLVHVNRPTDLSICTSSETRK